MIILFIISLQNVITITIIIIIITICLFLWLLSFCLELLDPAEDARTRTSPAI